MGTGPPERSGPSERVERVERVELERPGRLGGAGPFGTLLPLGFGSLFRVWAAFRLDRVPRPPT